MSSSYWKSKYFRIIIIVFTMSTLLFILMLQNVMHQSDIPPNEKDYKSVTFTTLYKQLDNNKVSTLYFPLGITLYCQLLLSILNL